MKAILVRAAFGMFLTALLPGCALPMSLFPAVDQERSRIQTELLGNWQEEEGEVRLEVSSGGEQSYQVTWVDEEARIPFEVLLEPLEEPYFLADVKALWEPPENLELWVHPLHSFALVKLESKDRLELAFPDQEALQRLGSELNLVHLRQDSWDRTLLITVPSEALRSWIGRHYLDGALFSEKGVFRRVAGEEPPGR